MDNHTNTPSQNSLEGKMLFLMPNQQRQSTEGISTFKYDNVEGVSPKLLTYGTI